MAQPLSESCADASRIRQDNAELAQGLATFTDAARRLEASYVALKERAAAIDLELRDTNAALQAALSARDRLLAALPLGVLAFDSEANVVWCNDAARTLLHERAPATVADWPVGERDLEGRRVLVRRAPMDGGGTLVLLEDRSQVVHLEREVDRLDRLAGLSELALGIAHEIKNPLNGVCGFAALLQRSKDPAEMQRFAARVHEGLGQIDRIVRELLAFARPGAAGTRPIPLRAAIEEAARAASLPVERVRAGGALDVTVEAAVVRVLTNLLRNAAEAAGGDVRIELDATSARDGLHITVRDNGPGVPYELADRLFQPFVSSKVRGTGLGLALSQRVLSFLHGSVRLLNPGEAGATFRVSLPPRASEKISDAGA